MLLGVLSTAMFAEVQGTPAAEQLFAQERWSDVAQQLGAVHDRSAEQEYEYGIALSHLQQWQEARAAFIRGIRLEPNDKRFPTELAGVAFKQKDNRKASAYLRRALRLDPKDDYCNEFLATIYFLQDNLEAAVKYWNRLSKPKPQINELRNDPPLLIRPALLDHAFTFSPGGILELDQLRVTEARLHNLTIFRSYRLNLIARTDGSFDSVFRAQELNAFGNSKMEAILRALSGLPFQEIAPDYYNANGTATNILSRARWDAEKRRYSAVISGPFGESPEWRYQFSADGRNENWNIRNGFTGPAPLLAFLNLRREAASAEINRLVGWRAQWGVGVELSHRDYRNVVPGSVLTPQLLAHGFQLKQTIGLRYEILRSPEHRLSVSGNATSQVGRLWSHPGQQTSEKVQASLQAHWYPRSRGDDFETQWRFGGGKTFGPIPFDELFMLGLERDNDPDLWMRAHIGTRGGRKGSAPLGRDYALSSWQTDKHIYGNGLFTVKVAPFIDTGKMIDAASTLEQKWLWDTGVEGKLTVLGVGVALIYGKDLRTGNNAFYVTLAH